MGKRNRLRATVVPGAFAEDVEFLPSDIVSGAMFDGGSTKIIINVQLQTAVKLQATIDGVVFGHLNSGNALIAGAIMEFAIRVKHGALINLRTDDAAGTTVDFCEIHEDTT